MERQWQQEAAAALSGFWEWRQQHPRATLTEIEAALDERWAVARARLVQDAALAGAGTDVGGSGAARPVCPDCGTPMEARGRETRRLTTTHAQPLTLPRRRAVCPACGTGLSPPG